VLRHRSEEIAAKMIWAARGVAAPHNDEWDEEALGPHPLRSSSAEETEPRPTLACGWRTWRRK
jgi:hypothetical protein